MVRAQKFILPEIRDQIHLWLAPIGSYSGEMGEESTSVLGSVVLMYDS